MTTDASRQSEVGIRVDNAGRDLPGEESGSSVIEKVLNSESTRSHLPVPIQKHSTSTIYRKRLLKALACPPALLIISGCHIVLALSYWIAFLTSKDHLYFPVASSYTVVAFISMWKVRETFRKTDIRPQ